MQAINLTPTSYIVLGLLEWLDEGGTPYDLKKLAAGSVGYFWSVQHAQLYSEPERLARAGLLEEAREQTGRRRRRYRLTDAGREALERWRRTPSESFTELRDPGLLQLFFGAEPVALARRQRELHADRLQEYELLHAQLPAETPAGPRRALEAGIGHEREWVRFWSEVAGT
jgi:PadR family transcriptional regulator, regulatory protein AphA